VTPLRPQQLANRSTDPASIRCLTVRTRAKFCRPPFRGDKRVLERGGTASLRARYGKDRSPVASASCTQASPYCAIPLHRSYVALLSPLNLDPLFDGSNPRGVLLSSLEGGRASLRARRVKGRIFNGNLESPSSWLVASSSPVLLERRTDRPDIVHENGAGPNTAKPLGLLTWRVIDPTHLADPGRREGGRIRRLEPPGNVRPSARVFCVARPRRTGRRDGPAWRGRRPYRRCWHDRCWLDPRMQRPRR